MALRRRPRTHPRLERPGDPGFREPRLCEERGGHEEGGVPVPAQCDRLRRQECGEEDAGEGEGDRELEQQEARIGTGAAARVKG